MSGSYCTLVCSMVWHAVYFFSIGYPDLSVKNRQHSQNQHPSKLYMCTKVCYLIMSNTTV